jgi:TatD DNase family protein
VVDTHCHLDSCAPDDADLISRAREAGVRRLATVGTDEASIARALGAANAHEEVVAIVGRHPHETTGFAAGDLEPIEVAAKDSRARAIGETGLDHYRDNAPREDQRRAFEAHIDLAGRLDMPLVIHTRAAERETFEILGERAHALTVVMHCFSAPDRLQDCVEHGWLCSFAGNVTYPSAGALQAAARDVPDDLLLLETDSPYLAPQPVRGRPNEPAHVVTTAEAVARLRGVSYTELEATVERNAARVFGW